MTEFELNSDQQNVLKWLDAGHNVFLTGVAGTGKTAALDRWLRATDKAVGITASTGIAATHLGGGTLHSWLGAAPERDTVERLCNDSWDERHGSRLRSVDTLVIDEVSMVDGKLFTLADSAHRYARKDDRPWGGMQIVLVGDLGQLPPVQEDDNGWCFQSQSWGVSNIQVLELLKVMRQEGQKFADILRRIRIGHLDPEVFETLSSRVHAYDADTDESAVRLMTHNRQADAVNDAKLSAMKGKAKTYYADDTGENPYLRQLQRACLSPERLTLKVGAKVMFTRNSVAGGWCNGTMGEVVKLKKDSVEVRIGEGKMSRVVEVGEEKWERKQWGDGGTLRVVASRKQLPLRLAWAITIHKSQGMTIERVSVNLSQTFAPGQAYVALSRCKSLEGLNIEAWRGLDSIKVHPMVAQSCARA